MRVGASSGSPYRLGKIVALASQKRRARHLYGIALVETTTQSRCAADRCYPQNPGITLARSGALFNLFEQLSRLLED